jgi:hypothetical protein
MGKSIAGKSLVQGVILQPCRFQFEVPWVRCNAQFLHPPLSCHHEPALKGLLRNWKTKGPQVTRPSLKTVNVKGVPRFQRSNKSFHINYLAEILIYLWTSPLDLLIYLWTSPLDLVFFSVPLFLQGRPSFSPHAYKTSSLSHCLGSASEVM